MFNYKFEKSKYPIYLISFITIIIFSIYGIFNIIKNYHLNFNVKNYFTPIKPITLNISTKQQIKKPVFICYDNNCFEPEGTILSNVYLSSFGKQKKNSSDLKIKNISLAYPLDYKAFEKDLTGIDLYIGKDRYYFSNQDIKNLDSKTVEIELENSKNKEKYKTVLLNDKGNYYGIFSDFKANFLSLFYHWNHYIIPYFWLIMAFLIYIFKKEEINLNLPKINSYYILALILLMGIIFRIDASIVSLILGILFIPIIYLFLRKIDEKTALFVSFLFSINLTFIYPIAEIKDSVLNKEIISQLVNEFFINPYIFAFFAIIILTNIILCTISNNKLEKINIKINQKKRILFLTLNLVFIASSVIITLFSIKFNYNILYILYYLLFLIEALCVFGIFDFINFNKPLKAFRIIYTTILLAIFFQITNNISLKQANAFDDFIFLLKNESKIYQDYEIHSISSNSLDIEKYPEIKDSNIKWHYINTKKEGLLEIIKKTDYIDKNKKGIIYINSTAGNLSNIMLQNIKSDRFYSNSTDTLRIINNPKGEQ